MTNTMKALRAHAPFDYRYEDVPLPEIGPGELLLKVKGCGICAGDLKSYHGGIRIWGTRPENRYIDAPVIGGHEFYGEVVEIGSGVSGYEMGDLVVSEQIVPCHECSFCQQKKFWLCKESAVFGFKEHCQGGFAEYIKLPKACINHHVPKHFTMEQAVLIEPIACGMHAIEQAKIQHHDIVVIAGLGAIGLSMVNLAQLHLPACIIGIDVKPHRMALGKEYGADAVLNPMTCNIEEEIGRLTDGKGCSVYVEASGSPQSVTQGLQILQNQGRFIQMGVFAEEVTADWNIIGDGKELRIIGSHLSGWTYPSVIKGITTGRIKTDNLISHSYPLEKWKEAFTLLETDDKVMKIILTP